VFIPARSGRRCEAVETYLIGGEGCVAVSVPLAHPWDSEQRRIVSGRGSKAYWIFTWSPILLSTAAEQDRPREWGWHMNHPGGFRNGQDRRSFLFSKCVGVWRRDLEASTDRLPAYCLAGFVSCVDHTHMARP
jgi:hypothetical protein